MIDRLEYRKAISVIREIPTDGHSPLLVISDDYNQYVVKSTKIAFPDCSIINEFLCHYFLKCWGVATPDIAAVILSKELLPDNLSENHKPHYYDIPCFGSKFEKSEFEAMELITVSKSFYKKIANVEDLFLISIFDIWVENDDRKPSNTNLIFVKENNNCYYLKAIDHCFVFSSMSYLNLNPQFVAFSWNDSILDSSIGLSIIKHTKVDRTFIEKMKQKFYFCVNQTKDNFHEIVKIIPQDFGLNKESQEKVFDFLFNENRVKSVFEEFYNKINSITNEIVL